MHRYDEGEAGEAEKHHIIQQTAPLSECCLLVVPSGIKSRIGGQAYSDQAALVWNQTGGWMGDSLATFKTKMKTFL